MHTIKDYIYNVLFLVGVLGVFVVAAAILILMCKGVCMIIPM